MDTVIKIDNLYKEYRLGTLGYGTLREDIQSWWAQLRGRPDPNTLVDLNNNKNDYNSKDRILALDNVNIEVKRGDRLGIIGKNGAGKTTLLKILSRISSPSSGEVKIQGKVASLLAVGAGFHQELSGRENIYLNGAILGLNKTEITNRLDAIVEFSGVEKFIDTPVKRYSSGMYVRLGFAVAAYLDPDILIVDEVLAVGDYEFQKKCLERKNNSEFFFLNLLTFIFINITASPYGVSSIVRSLQCKEPFIIMYLGNMNVMFTRGFIFEQLRKGKRSKQMYLKLLEACCVV